VAAGSAWSVEDEIRFAALQKQGEEARHSEGLRELLDLATVATARRVMDAARDVAHNRAESDRADRESILNLEAAFNPSDPARLVARALLAQSHRTAANLRRGVEKLEQEASLALETHAADVKSLSDRLVAKYEAHERLLLQSLSEAESGGRQSISSLQAEIVRIERDRASEISSRDEELSRRQARVEELETALSEEQQWRRFESRNSGTELRSLKQEVARLEVEVDREKKERAQDAYHLGIQLATASAEAGNSTKGFDQKLREAQVAYAELQERSEGLLAIEKQQNRAKRKELEQQLAAALASKQKREGELLRVLDSLQADKETMELKLNTQLKRLEAVKEQEKAVLRARVDRLSKLQDKALEAGGSTKARAILFYDKLKSKVKPEGSLSWRGENEPNPLVPAEGHAPAGEEAEEVALGNGRDEADGYFEEVQQHDQHVDGEHEYDAA